MWSTTSNKYVPCSRNLFQQVEVVLLVTRVCSNTSFFNLFLYCFVKGPSRSITTTLVIHSHVRPTFFCKHIYQNIYKLLFLSSSISSSFYICYVCLDAFLGRIGSTSFKALLMGPTSTENHQKKLGIDWPKGCPALMLTSKLLRHLEVVIPSEYFLTK